VTTSLTIQYNKSTCDSFINIQCGLQISIHEKVDLHVSNLKILSFLAFHENLYFRGHAKNLSLGVARPQGIEMTQRMHFWICRDLIFVNKLVRSELNLQILRYFNFSDQIQQILATQVEARFPVQPYYS